MAAADQDGVLARRLADPTGDGALVAHHVRGAEVVGRAAVLRRAQQWCAEGGLVGVVQVDEQV